MPIFDESARNPRGALARDYSYSKLIAFANRSSDRNVMSRTSRISVAFKDTDNYHNVLREATEEEYADIAGCDLSTLFMPSRSNTVGASGIPVFYSPLPSGGKNYNNINIFRLLPFEWDSDADSVIKDLAFAPSGDSLGSLVSSDRMYLDVDRYRGLDDVRNIGFRLPMMGIGWGFTVDGIPCPSGNAPAGQTEGVHYPSGAKFFKGGKLDGYELDPSDYISAPIDIRFDPERCVWTTVSDVQTFWIELTGEGAGLDEGWYSWKQIIPDPLDPTIWSDADPPVTGSLTAREINDRTELANSSPARYLAHLIGTNEDGNPVYIFEAGNLPVGQYQHQLYGMVVALGAGWELPLAVPDLNEVEA